MQHEPRPVSAWCLFLFLSSPFPRLFSPLFFSFILSLQRHDRVAAHKSVITAAIMIVRGPSGERLALFSFSLRTFRRERERKGTMSRVVSYRQTPRVIPRVVSSPRGVCPSSELLIGALIERRTASIHTHTVTITFSLISFDPLSIDREAICYDTLCNVYLPTRVPFVRSSLSFSSHSVLTLFLYSHR